MSCLSSSLICGLDQASHFEGAGYRVAHSHSSGLGTLVLSSPTDPIPALSALASNGWAFLAEVSVSGSDDRLIACDGKEISVVNTLQGRVSPVAEIGPDGVSEGLAEALAYWRIRNSTAVKLGLKQTAGPPSAQPPIDTAAVVGLIGSGSASGNPGAGGWACIVRQGEYRVELSGGAARATKNRMELTAVIEGLKALPEGCRAEVITDAEFLYKGMTEWIAAWKQRGWRTSSGQAVANQELWQDIETAVARHQSVQWRWSEDRSGHPDHERAGILASEAARRQAAA